jgi:hypothetical protein
LETQLLRKSIWWELRYSDEATTAHPFKPETWRDEGGNLRVNHPTLDLVADPELITSLPEVEFFPPLRHVLTAVNVSTQVFRSTQSTSGVHTNAARSRFEAGANVHIAYREEERNKWPCNLADAGLAISSHLPVRSVEGARIILTVEPYKSWHLRQGYFGLSLNFYCSADASRTACEGASMVAAQLAIAINKGAPMVRVTGL